MKHPITSSLLLALVALPINATTIDVDPQATYLMTYQDVGTDIHTGLIESAKDAVPIDLAALGLTPGDCVTMRALGAYSYYWRSVGADVFVNGMLGVFSSSPTLLASDQLHRVADAVDAGADIVSLTTYYGGYDTDIPEDFFIADAGTTLTIPTGAAYLFLSPHETLFWDNVPGPSGFQMEITKVLCPVADTTSTVGLALMGLLVLSGIQRRRLFA